MIVTNQINGIYELRRTNLMKYVAKVEELAVTLDKFEIQHTSHDQKTNEHTR